MASEKAELSDFYLLQPELLNEPVLISILESRCIRVQNMHSMNKEQLVELFHRVAVPLPQRMYKENRRGNILTKMRKKQERKIQKAESTEQKSSITYGFSDSPSSKRHNSHNLSNSHPVKDRLKPPPGDRLKPPPDAINFERKKIKLNSSSDEVETSRGKKLKKSVEDTLDRIIIKDRRKEREKKTENESPKEKAVIECKTNIDTSSSNSHENDSKKTESRKIKLKRPRSNSSSENSSSPSEPNNGESKKHRIIKWP